MDWWGPTFDREKYEFQPRKNIPSYLSLDVPPTIIESTGLSDIRFIGANTAILDEFCVRTTKSFNLNDYVLMEYDEWLKNLGIDENGDNPVKYADKESEFSKMEEKCKKYLDYTSRDLRVKVLMTHSVVDVLWEVVLQSTFYSLVTIVRTACQIKP